MIHASNPATPWPRCGVRPLLTTHLTGIWARVTCPACLAQRETQRRTGGPCRALGRPDPPAGGGEG